MSKTCQWIARGLRIVGTCGLAVAVHGTQAKAPGLEPPAAEALAEARRIVETMKASSRGPYSQIRWFCNDGSVHPPQPYACAERGGGRQHGEYSKGRLRLAELGWPVGTVLAATSREELWSAKPRQGRLRELPLERYLIEIDDGWVMRGARTYRGHVQIEDEERAGRELLLGVLAEGEWIKDNYLLARELARVLPHGAGEDRLRTVRRVSQEIAQATPSFEPVRVEIHTAPGPGSAARTRKWIESNRGRLEATLIARAETLATDLDALYAASRRGERLEAALTAAGRAATGPRFRELLAGLAARPEAERIPRLAQALRAIREVVEAPGKPELRLQWLDLATEVENELVATAIARVGRPELTREELIGTALDLLDGGYGAGLLSLREHEAIAGPLEALVGETTVATTDYLDAVRQLRRGPDWAASTVRFHFAEALTTFGALEPAAWRFVDDVLRSSALFPLADVSRILALDADARSRLTHGFFGASHAATLGLNPGVARGKLRIVRPEDLQGGLKLSSDEIVVLPETVSDLDPVAGILSLSAGNLLSHVQLLARNLGIPNATLPARLLPQLEARDGQRVLFAVGTRGSVFLDALESIPPAVIDSLNAKGTRKSATLLDPPRPDLTLRQPLALNQLHAGLSGKVVGPKAANLGELARMFPGRVSPAVALPFGIFAESVTAGADAPRARLDRAFARFRAAEIDRQTLDAEVERVRLAIRGLKLSSTQRERILPLMRESFGADGSYGVFVRSDTNVEDLPGFTGAGLNETVPHVVGLAEQLAAIPRVWSSPFTSRAMAWRSAILTRPEEVYTSVLLQKSVPADKSGVLVTTDLGRRGPGLTLAMAWGVGGAVDGEAAEQIAIGEDGTQRLLAEAKAPYRRRLEETGGVKWIPAKAGAVLDRTEIEALRAFAAEALERLKPVPGPDGRPLPWDIELGFVGGKLMLFQVRPLVERGDALADSIVDRLIPAGGAEASRTPLDQPPIVERENTK